MQYFAYRYRNKVLHNLDFVFASLGPSESKTVMRLAFGSNWKAVIRQLYDEKEDARTAAASLATMSLRHLVATISRECRETALSAIKTGDKAELVSSRLLDIVQRLGLISKKDIWHKAAVYDLIGALEARFGIELDNYRTARLLED